MGRCQPGWRGDRHSAARNGKWWRRTVHCTVKREGPQRPDRRRGPDTRCLPTAGSPNWIQAARTKAARDPFLRCARFAILDHIKRPQRRRTHHLHQRARRVSNAGNYIREMPGWHIQTHRLPDLLHRTPHHDHHHTHRPPLPPAAHPTRPENQNVQHFCVLIADILRS